MSNSETYLKRIWQILSEYDVTSQPSMMSDEMYLQRIWAILSGQDVSVSYLNSSQEIYLQRIWQLVADVAVSVTGTQTSSEVYLQRIWQTLATMDVTSLNSLTSREKYYQRLTEFDADDWGLSETTYASILRDTYEADEVWPLVNIANGSTIPAFVNSDRDGSLVGWDLQDEAGPVPGTLAPYSDGVNDYGNVYTSNGITGLADIFDGDEGSLFIWAKVSSAGVWTDSTLRYFWGLRTNAGHYISCFKLTGSNSLSIWRNASSLKQHNATLSTTDWFSLGFSWSAAADQSKFFIDGAQVGPTRTGIGVMSGALTTTGQNIMANATTPTNVWHGFGSYAAIRFGIIWTPAQFLGMHNDAATAGAD